MSGADRLTVSEALAVIAREVRPLGLEQVQLDARANGRTLAAPVFARQNSPRFRASAMDGFALRIAETDTRLSLSPPIWAGAAAPPLPPRHAAPIATGAPVPEGADAVVPREQATACGDQIFVERAVRAGANIRMAGEDARAGDKILGKNARLSAAGVAALLSYGVREVSVRRVPRILVLTTGSELEAGPGLSEAGLIDSNGPMIEAMCADAGLPCRRLGAVADDAASIGRALFAIAPDRDFDIVVSTGGVSAGTLDLVRPGLERAGARIVFHGVAMRPGKPLLFALLADGRPWFGLPGNPAAAMVGFRFFVMAAVREMLALAPETGQEVASDYPPRAGATLFLRAQRQADGAIDTGLDQRSHVLRSMLAADGWVRVEPDERAGGSAFYPFDPIV